MSATFDEWAKAVFDHAPSEREWYWDDDSEAFWDSLALSDVVVVEYMTRLFSEPSQLQNYSLEYLAQGLWFLIGESSPGDMAYAVINRDVMLEQRVRCIRSIANFFRVFVAPVAQGPAGRKGNPFHSVCYMWWDIFLTYGGARNTGETEIDSAFLDTMAEILTLEPELCRLSALHGLNHWHEYHPERVEQIVDAFLRETEDLTPRVLEYAHTARAGMAQ